MEERGGLVTAEDLRPTRPCWSEPVAVEFRGFDAANRERGSPTSLLRSRALPELAGPRAAGAGARARRRAARRRAPTAERNDEPLRGGRRRQRLRADDEPRPRLGRLPPRPRPPPEQHARGGRPADRVARAGRADGEHDGARRSPSTRTASRSQPEQRAAPACAARCSRSSRGSSTRASNRRPPSAGPASTRREPLVHLEPGFDSGDDRRARVGGFQSARVARPPPLLRRRQRRHADRRRG